MTFRQGGGSRQMRKAPTVATRRDCRNFFSVSKGKDKCNTK